MKKRIKRLFSFTMATVLVALSLSTSVLAASEEVSLESNDLGYSMDYDQENIKVINTTTGEVYDYADTSSEEEFDLDSCYTDVTNEELSDDEAERLKEFFSALDNDELDVVDISSEESQSHIETYTVESGEELKIWVIEYGSADTIKDYDFSYVDGRLKLSKEGYYSVDVDAAEVGIADSLNQTIDTVKLALVPKETGSNIAAVYCNGKDVIANKVSIDDSKRGETNVYVVPADGVDKNADIGLVSNKSDPMSGALVTRKMKADGGNYAVIPIEPQYFPQNSKHDGLCFRIYNDGNTDRSGIGSNLQIGKDKPTFAVGFDSDFSFTIPKSVPVIGGGTVGMELAQLPLHVKVESNKVRIGINTKQSYVDSGEGWNEYKRWLEDTAKAKKARDDSIEKFLNKENTPFKAGFKGGFNLQIGGMLEIDWDEEKEVPTRVGGCLVFSTDVSVNGEWQVFIVVVPVVIKVSVSVGFNALVQVGYDIRHSKAYINGQLTFILPKIRLTGGIGCAKVADVSLYGQGANKVDIDISESRGIVMAGLEGEAGVSVKVLFFKYEKALWKGRWQYYRGTGRDKPAKEVVSYYPEDAVAYVSFEDAQSEAADFENYIIDRSYVDNQSEWLPVDENQDALNALDSNVTSNNVNDTIILQRSVFFSASPQIITAENGTKLLVWTSDIKDRATGDHTAIVYSVYDVINGVWSEPEILYDDGTLDNAPEAIAVGDKIYIAWMDSSKKGYGDEVSPSEVAKDVEISVAEFDTWTNSVTKIMNTGKNNTLELYPHLAVHDEEPYLIWATNSTNDFYGAGINTVKYANLNSVEGNVILGKDVLSTDKAIEDVAVGEIDSELCVSYILGSTDSSQEEIHEHGIHVRSVSENEIDSIIFGQDLPTSGLKMSKVNGKSILTWASEGKLYYSEDGKTYGTMVAASDISPDYVIVNRNEKDVLLCTNASEKETDIFYHEMDGYSIKKPVQISDADGYITSFSAADTFDSLDIAYSKTISSITNEGVYESRDICIKSIPTEGYSNVEIEDCYHDETLVKSNATVPFTVTVKNNGLINQDHVRYAVYKDDAEEINRKYIVGDINSLQVKSLDLPVGETASFTIDVPVGEIEEKSKIGVMVASGDNDIDNPHFDITDAWIGYPDLNLSVDSVNSEYNYAVNAIVSNVGAIDTKAYLNIIEGGQDGEIVKTCYLGDIKAGETKEYEISSSILNSINFNQETVTFEAVSTTEEYYLYNNTDYIHKHIEGEIVSFDANGGECKTQSKTIAPGTKYGGLPKAQRKGYTFLGWYAGDTKITPETEFTADSPKDLMAKWQANEYTVYFNTGYDVNVEPIKVKYDEPYGTLPTPVLPGVVFEGWYLRGEKEAEGHINYEIKSDTIVDTADDHELVAKVKPINDTIKPVFYDGETNEELTGNVVLKKGKSVKIKTATKGATLYYTMDRSTPDPMYLGGDSIEGTHVYDDEIVISKNAKIKAIAAKHGYNNSPVAILNVTVEEDWGDIDNPQMFDNDITKVPAGLWLSGVENKTYTGKAIKQDVKVYYHTTLLKEKQDYSVSYKNNINVGNAQITVTGKRGCKGKITQAFSIGRVNIGTSRLIADDIIVAYNGKVQKKKTTVKYKFDDRTVTLKEGKDFFFDYDTGTAGHSSERAYLEEGDYRVVICGIGNYDGLGAFNEKITKCNIISKASVSNVKTLYYDGTAKEQPKIEVKYAGKKLVAGEDYRVSYENNILPGTAKLVITGINKFAGAKKVDFVIKGTDIRKTDITISNNSIYTGEEIKPTVRIINKNSVSANLIEGVDFTVSYSDNVKAGKKAKIVIKGSNGYTGTVKKNFEIKPYEIKAISGNRISANADASYKYTKGGAKPLPVLTDGSYTLINGKDYKIKYKNNTYVHNGTGKDAPSMEVSGIGNYSGKLIFNYAIEKKSISDNEISISANDVIYKNKAGVYKSKVVVKDANGKNLTPGKDYKNIVYSYGEDTVVNQAEGRNSFKQYVRKAGEKIDDKDIIPVGTEITVTISGDGNYFDDGHAYFRCIAADISKAKVTIAPQYYTGKAVRITRNDIKSITIGKADLKREDFEIVGYKNNINPGKATVIIRGKGGFGGEKAVTFIIMPKEIPNDSKSVTSNLGKMLANLHN